MSRKKLIKLFIEKQVLRKPGRSPLNIIDKIKPQRMAI